MKYLVVSDIHGSSYYANKINEIFNKEKVDKIILLGDLYYHGPRNPLTKEYNPMLVAGVLNDLSDKISYDLKNRGMKFVGSTIIYSFLQSIGYIYSHDKECYMYKIKRSSY